MTCPHTDYSYQRRCLDCGRMVKGGLTRIDVLFCFAIGIAVGLVSSFLATLI